MKDMDITQSASLSAITVLVYLLASLLKALFPGEKISALIPSLCGLFGGLIGVGCFFISPGLMPAGNWMSAFAAGAVSGLSATGINQVSKQLARLAQSGQAEGAQEGDDPDA